MRQIFQKYFKYFILALLLYMPVFGFIDKLPLRIWDEARVAVNAHEMLTNGNYIVTYYDGKPDMWSTKPPFLIWMQVISMKLFGESDLATRLPISISVFLTCMCLLLFLKRYLRDFWLGFITVLCLITTSGYIGWHVGRTGDYDAPLTLFTTAYCLFFFTYLETRRTLFLYAFFGALTLAVLTKGVAGVMFVPALPLYALLSKSLLFLLKNKHVYIGTSVFLFISIGYYLLRDSMNPGFLDVIFGYEMGRFMVPLADVPFDALYYYNLFVNDHMADRYLLIPCGIIIGLASKNERLKKLSLFIFIASLFFFVAITASKTKTLWYDAPLYPFLAFNIAVVIHFLFNLLSNINHAKTFLSKNVLPFIMLFLVFTPSYRKIWDYTYHPQEQFWDREFYEMGYYLKDAINGKHNLNNKYLVYGGYIAHNLFYVEVLQNKGVKFRMKDVGSIKKNDELVICQNDIKTYIGQHYTYDVLETNKSIMIIKITGTIPENAI